MNLFISVLWENPQFFFYSLFCVIFSVCLHEYAHSRSAYAFGDTTAADAGYLTLNPLRVMGWTAIFAFLILGIAWGAVPVNTQVLKQRSKYAP